METFNFSSKVKSNIIKFYMNICLYYSLFIMNILLPYFPILLIFYSNTNNIIYIDTKPDNINNKYRLQYLLNKNPQLNLIKKYIKKANVLFKNNNKIYANKIDTVEDEELISGEDYMFNTVNLQTEDDNVLYKLD